MARKPPQPGDFIGNHPWDDRETIARLSARYNTGRPQKAVEDGVDEEGKPTYRLEDLSDGSLVGFYMT